MPAAYKQEVKIGTATILCSTDGEVKEYDAEIRKIDLNHEDTNKSFVIKVTDKELLEATGGIVQGPGYPEWKNHWCGNSCICSGCFQRIWNLY